MEALPLDGAPDPVEDEARALPEDGEGDHADGEHELPDPFHGLVGGRGPPHQLHDGAPPGAGVEVCVEDPVGSARCALYLGDADGGAVRRQYRAFVADEVELPEHIPLQLEPLGDRLYHEVNIRSRVHQVVR